MDNTKVLVQLEELGIVPVIRTLRQDTAMRAVDWLADAGFRTFEITLTTPGAFEIIKQYSRQSELLVGAGTVLSIEAARQSIDAGARYVVSPCIVPGLPAATNAYGIPCMLGALTPTEVIQAGEEGANAIKVFPVSSVGGAAYIKALKSIFPDKSFCPTGGIGIQDIPEYFSAGAKFVGVGGKLVNEQALSAGDRPAVIDIATAVLKHIEHRRA